MTCGDAEVLRMKPELEQQRQALQWQRVDAVGWHARRSANINHHAATPAKRERSCKRDRSSADDQNRR